MRFGDLACPNLALNYQRHARYFRYLAECGLKRDDLVYQTFALNHYHDSPLRIRPFRTRAHTLTIGLRNIVVSDAISAFLLDSKTKQTDIPNNCFETEIEFQGVHLLTISFGIHISHPNCYQILIGKRRGLYTIDFEVEEGSKYVSRHGQMMIEFERLRVEDIRPKIARILRRKLPDLPDLDGVKHGPEYYARHYAKESGMKQ